MSLLLNGVETSKVMWNGIETTGYFNGNMVWGYEPKPTSALLYTSAFDFTAKAGTKQTMQMNYDLPTGTYNYFACKFGVCWPNGCGMEDDYNCVSNNFDWSLIICSPVPSTAVPIYWGNKTNWTQTGCSTAAKGNSRIIWYTGANCKSIRPYKAVYDNVNERALLYYDNQARMTFTGVGKCTQIQKLYHHCWTTFSVTARCSSCYIAGFKDLTAAQAW